MHYKSILSVLLYLGILTFTNCQSKSTSDQDHATAILTGDQDTIPEPGSKTILLTADGLQEIRSGVHLQALIKEGRLKEGVLETGDGTFTIWSILDKNLGNIGYVMEHPVYPGQVGGIYITSPRVATDKKIRVGSTWADLQKVYPGIQAHGSEIEGVVTASGGGYNFQLDHRHWSYGMDQSTIKPKTKIDLIWLSHTLEEDDVTATENWPDHFICFTNNANSQQRIWVGYSQDENAILVKHEGQDEAMNLTFEKEEYLKDGAYPTIIRFYKEVYQGSITGHYKITHSGNWDYVEYQAEKSDQKINYTIDHDANPYGKEPCF